MTRQQKQQLDKKFTKKLLTKLYWDNKLSHNEIARKYKNATYDYIWMRFKRLNIPRRTRKESVKIAMVKFEKNRKRCNRAASLVGRCRSS